MAARRFFAAAQKQHERPVRPIPSPAYVLDQMTQPREIGHLEDPLLSVEEVRDVLGLGSIQGVYRLIRHHALPVRRLGRAIRIDQGELEQWTRRQRQDERQRVVVLRGV
jgi:excisionase family DNA binding protein